MPASWRQHPRDLFDVGLLLEDKRADIYLMEGGGLKRRVFADADFQEAINRGEIDPEGSDYPGAAS